MALTKVRGSGIDADGQEVILDADADTTITADTDDQIDVKVAGTDQITIKDGAISPVTNNDVDLGTSSLGYKDIYVTSQLKFANFEIGDQAIDGNTIIFRKADESESIRITSGPLVRGGTSGNALGFSSGAAASPFGFELAANGTGGYAFTRDCTGSSAVMQVFGTGGETRLKGDGDVENTNNSYGAISDLNLKENIADSGSQWDDIKAVKVKKYSLKKDKADKANMIGVIAQDLEASNMGGLVSEFEQEDADWKKTGEKTKTVKYSILYMKSVKALQEAMVRIETLEAKVKALEEA